jgi:hypothetical protein
MTAPAELRWQVGERKARYSKAAAKRVERWWKANGEKGMRAYRCGYCGKHHVGRRPPWQIVHIIRERIRREV